MAFNKADKPEGAKVEEAAFAEEKKYVFSAVRRTA